MKTYETTEMINRLHDMATQILSPGSEGKALFEGIADRLHELEIALSESLKLQCHYAGILNGYDSGRRTTTFYNHSWIKRLNLIGGILKRSKEVTESNESSDKLWKKTSVECAPSEIEIAVQHQTEICQLIAGWRTTTPKGEWTEFDEHCYKSASSVLEVLVKLESGKEHIAEALTAIAQKFRLKEAKGVNPPPISNAHVEPGCEQFHVGD